VTVDAPRVLPPLEPIRERFFETGDGLEAVRQRADAVDQAVVRLFQQVIAKENSPGLALAAVGGYGRRQLFPSSDVDLLFLVEKPTAVNAARDKPQLPSAEELAVLRRDAKIAAFLRNEPA